MVAGEHQLRGRRNGSSYKCAEQHGLNVNMRLKGKEMLRGRKSEDKNEYGDRIEE